MHLNETLKLDDFSRQLDGWLGEPSLEHDLYIINLISCLRTSYNSLIDEKTCRNKSIYQIYNQRAEILVFKQRVVYLPNFRPTFQDSKIQNLELQNHDLTGGKAKDYSP